MDRASLSRTRFATLALIFGLGLAGCTGPAEESGKKGASGTAGGSTAKPRIVLITNGNSDWWSAVEKGMNDGAEKFGADVEMKRNDGSANGQITLLEDAASRAGVQGVAVSVVEAETPGIADAIRKVKDAGKVIITIDSDISASAADTRRAYIGTNNTKAGEIAGKAAAALRPQGGTVAVFVGTAAAANARERLDGFFAGAGDKFTKPPIEIFEDGADVNKAQQLAEVSITKHPDTGVMLGLYSYNAPRIAAEVAKAPEFRKKTNVVTFDLDEQAVEHLERKDIDVSVCQNPYEIGLQAVRLVRAYIVEDKATIDEMLPKGATVVDVPVRVIVPDASSPVKGEGVITIEAMKQWLGTKGLKSS